MTSAVTQVNSIRPRYAKSGVANVPKILKPIPDEKQRTEASSGLPGVVGDSGRQLNSQGFWESPPGVTCAEHVLVTTFLRNQ
jgi:hypothetical protein